MYILHSIFTEQIKALHELQSILMSFLCVQFAEKFAEYKEAARLAKEKSQEKTEMAKSPSQVRSYHTIATLLSPIAFC